MPTTRTRTRTTRNTRPRRAATRKQTEEEPSTTAAKAPPAPKPTPSSVRSTHRGSRGTRKSRRAAAASPVPAPAAKNGAVAAPAKPKSQKQRSTRPARPRAKKAAAKTAATPKATPRKASTKTAARPKSRKPFATATQRARIPVTGAPTDEVPAPFAHNAEYEFARILDFYGIDWTYEPRTFALRTDGDRVVEAFTPDFYLPDMDLYVELTTVKANLTAEKNRKMRLVKERYPDVKVMLLKKKDYLRLLANYGYGPLKPDQVPEIDKVLLTANKIERRIGELGAQISHDYANSQPVMVGVLRGVLCFISDLIRHVSVPLSVDLMAISSYDGNGGGAGAVRILKDLDENLRART